MAGRVVRGGLSYWFLVVPMLAVAIVLGPAWWYGEADFELNDPDLPEGANISKAEYLAAREEHISLMRGLDTAEPQSRSNAVREMEHAERAAANRGAALPVPKWRPLGPAPIPNGQTTGRTDPVSGRTTSIAVDPNDPNNVYAGTAGGGLYRSVNGGQTWTPMMDNALTLAIGSVVFAPSDPSILYVGTGEGGYSSDSYFGVGIYRINGANTPNPTITGPLNRNAAGADVFTGRSVGSIRVHPTNPDIIYAGIVTGTSYGGSTTGLTLPTLGLYRSTNATSASPVFDRLTVSAASTSRNILDIAMEPGNPERMFVTLVDREALGDGGIYFTTNASAANPTFTRLLSTGTTTETSRAELAISKAGNDVTVYCAHGLSNGRLSTATYDSTNPGTPSFTTYTAGGSQSFCNGQCFYDIAVAADPTNPARVYLAGSPTLAFGYSTNNGANFTTSATGLHVDTHAIAVAPSSPSTLYYGSDGGVWKSTDAGLNWTSLNNNGFSATQFVSIAVHPNERYYTLGGTQDNGTPYFFPNGSTWTRAVGGDGGFVAIDSGSVYPNSLVTYHTFFNQTNNQIGFARSTTFNSSHTPLYTSSFGCGFTTPNGINCADATLFYAPMVLGPNAPGSTGNTVYFGTTHLYRSINQGAAMTDVSGALPLRISAIGIAPKTDDIRLVGTTGGTLYLSTTSDATTMTNVTGTVPARYVGRVAISPVDNNTAYISLAGFGIPGQHVMKTTNLLSGLPTWAPAGNGIPDVPTLGLVIDPLNPNTLYAGTDIGVFRTMDGGANWEPFSEGLPRVPVFEIALQNSSRTLKIATHGRGIWEYSLNPNPRADFDGDGRTDLSIFRPSDGNWWTNRSAAGISVAGFGQNGDVPVPADYDGDGRTDMAVYRATVDGNLPDFYVFNSATSTVSSASWGVPGDVPVAGDYDGDGKADFSIWRGSQGLWWTLKSSGGFNVDVFGLAGDLPMAMDTDGDGKANLAAYRPSTGVWYVARSSGSGFDATAYGVTTDKPVPADYDGDNKDDIAVFRPSTGVWYISLSSGGQQIVAFGQNGDVPVPGDYDGDGKDDIAVYRNGTWFMFRSNAGILVAPFGGGSDISIPSKYVP